MQFLFDVLPIILFFIAYKIAGIYVATGIAIITALLQALWSWKTKGKVDKTLLVTVAILVIFGGMTILLRDPIFIMWKPTLVDLVLGLGLLGSQWFSAKPLMQRSLESKIFLPQPIWKRVNMMWALFFLILGALNLWVVYDYSGFYSSYHQLLSLSGLPEVDLSQCQTLFKDDLLRNCEIAHHSEEVWVNFKLFGTLGLTFLFVIIQAIYLARHIKEAPANSQNDNH